MRYFDELKRAMDIMAAKGDTMFVGQAVGVSGTFMFNTLAGVPPEKRLEFPVAESFQMQFSLGLSLSGTVPISIYPRQNFLALALGDMINMVDKVPAISGGRVRPKMIIRTAVGPDQPVHPGHQHIGDFTEAFERMFAHIRVRRLDEPEQIVPAYEEAYASEGTSLLIEVGNFYNAK
jgi:pyruvate/2-oxoglutarate/acetoin dehydrogenase E1 component